MWILILSLHWGQGAGLTTQEFTTETACLAAGKSWEEQVTRYVGSGHYLCVKKGK